MLDESIFNSIQVSNDIICSNYNAFSKSYKMAVSIKLNSTNFPPLRFPSASKNLSSPSDSLPFITARKSFPCNINIRSAKSIAIATNTSTSGVPRISQGNSFP